MTSGVGVNAVPFKVGKSLFRMSGLSPEKKFTRIPLVEGVGLV